MGFLASVDVRVYALLCNCIEPKSEKILRENQNGFRKKLSTTSQILTICRILKGVHVQKTYRQQYYSSTPPRHLTQHIERK